MLASSSLDGVAAELADMVFGPRHVSRPAVDRYLGLHYRDRMPPDPGNVWGASEQHVAWLHARLVTVGGTVRLRPEAWPAVSLDSRDRVESARRRRVAAVLGLPAPAPADGRPYWWTGQTRQAASVGRRVLTAVGPLYLDEVGAAVSRARRQRHPEPMDADLLAATLLIAGARIRASDGRWSHDGNPDGHDIALIRAAAATKRRSHSHAQTRSLLAAVGYSPTSTSTMIPRHPLIEAASHGRYRILGTAGRTPPTTTASPGTPVGPG